MNRQIVDRLAQTGLRVGVIVAALCWLGASWDVRANLVISDPSIINLYLFNEQSSGQLDNSFVPGFEPFTDTAPTGTPQNHEDFIDGPSDGPAWGSGANFAGIGTGTGLTFTRSDGDHTAAEGWQHLSQGNYSNGGSYTTMLRAFVTENNDNTVYNLYGDSSNFLQLEGVSGGAAARFDVRLRGLANSEADWLFDSFGTGASSTTGGSFSLQPNTWYNLFLIYEGNTAITLAADDGTTFSWLRTEDKPALFDSVTSGWSDATRPRAIAEHARLNPAINPFDGRLESIVTWDKALTLGEADAIGLTNIPEPATGLLVVLGAVGLLLRSRREQS